MAFVVIRDSDDAVVGLNSTSKTMDTGYTEIEKNPAPKFHPSFTKVKWTYDSVADTFTNTGLDMTW